MWKKREEKMKNWDERSGNVRLKSKNKEGGEEEKKKKREKEKRGNIKKRKS